MYPLVRELAATDAPLRVPVTVTCFGVGLLQAGVLRLGEAPCLRPRVGGGASDQRRRRRPPRRPGLRLPLHRRRARGARLHRLRAAGLAAVLPAAAVERLRQEARAEPKGRPTGARRPRGTGLHRDSPEPVVAHRHHRAPHERRQALPVRDQGRLLQPDRGLLHRLEDESLSGRLSAADGDRPA